MHIYFTAMLTRDGIFLKMERYRPRSRATEGANKREENGGERHSLWENRHLAARSEFAFRQDRRYQKDLFPPAAASSSSSSASSSSTSTRRRRLQKDTVERNGAFDIGRAKRNPNDTLPKHFANRSRMFSGGQASEFYSLARPSAVLRLALSAQYSQIRKPRSSSARERHF